MKYDFVVVGAGLFGAIVAHELHKAGKKVLVIERKTHVGGTIYTENRHGIQVHMYGAHIFRTNSREVWDYINQFTDFTPFINTPIARYNNEMYNLPINMNTFSKMWGVKTPAEAKEVIASQIVPNKNPNNLEEYVLSVVGRDIYEKLIKGYTEKQWGKKCTELPIDTIRRIPIRFTYNNNYYSNMRYQGIPVGGYTQIVEKLLEGIQVLYEMDGAGFAKCMSKSKEFSGKVIYTGCIDEFFNNIYGKLEYRSLRFEHRMYQTDNYQGVAVVNYTGSEVAYTRMIEHRHFEQVDVPYTIVTLEYPSTIGEPFYPMLDMNNLLLYQKYKELAKETMPKIIFAGRLGSYKYTDMEETISNALKLKNELLYKGESYENDD